MVEFTGSIYQKSRAETLHYLSKFYTIKKIAKIRNTSQQAVYKLFNKLREKDYIYKDRTLTDKGKALVEKALAHNKKLINQIRLHKFSVAIRIPKQKGDWTQKALRALRYKDIDHPKRGGLKSDQWDFTYNEQRIRLTRQSIILTLGDIYGRDSRGLINQAMDEIYTTIPKLENLFRIYIVKLGVPNISIISEHLALVENALAKQYNKEDRKFYIYGEDGKLRLIIDKSLNSNEFEAVHKDHAEEDIVKTKAVFDYYGKRTEEAFNEYLDPQVKTPMEQQLDIIRLGKLIMEQNKAFAENEARLAKNIEKHQILINEWVKEAEYRRKPFFIRWFHYFRKKHRKI